MAPPLAGWAALGTAGIAFRPVAEADLPFLQHLYRTVRWAELEPTHWPEETKRAFLDEQFGFQRRHYEMAWARAAFLLILRHGEPIGRIYVDRSGGTLHLVEISLLPEWRGQGLGTALLQGLQQEVTDGRADRVTLNVEVTNPAGRLYARLGFVEAQPAAEFLGLDREMVWPAPAEAVS
jgi:GNAT superfamily N-acetyltransferase